MILDELGLRYDTDKSSKMHDYLRHYESLFLPHRSRVRTLLEIGVLRGGSLFTWRDFFPHAMIVGVDVSERCRSYADDRILIEIGRQEDLDFLAVLKTKYQPDIIIDDGSHIWEHQIRTFEALYPSVVKGGFYVIEDLHTSRAERYGSPETKVASEYFGNLVAHIISDGVPLRQNDSAAARMAREQTELVVAGRRFIAFQKKEL